jgi:hypothetical protein
MFNVRSLLLLTGRDYLVAFVACGLAIGCGSSSSPPSGTGGSGHGGATARLDGAVPGTGGVTGSGGAPHLDASPPGSGGAAVPDGGTAPLDGGTGGVGGMQKDARMPDDSAESSGPDAPGSADGAMSFVDGGCLGQKIAIKADMLSVSSTYASYVPFAAFDGDMSRNSGWSAKAGEGKAWLAIDFGSARTIGQLRVFPDRYISTDPSYAYLDRFRVDVWAGGAWVSASTLVSTPEEQWYDVTVNATTQKLRIWAESDGSAPQIKEIEIYDSSCGPAFDGGTAPEAAPPLDAVPADGGGGCIEQKLAITADMLTASSTYSSYYPITAFDSDMSQNSGWSAAGGEQKAWLAVDIGTRRTISRVRVFPDRYLSTARNYAYLDRFRVDVWNGSDWAAASALISTPEEKWYEAALATSAQKLRIWAESDGNGPQIKEIEIYAAFCPEVADASLM